MGQSERDQAVRAVVNAVLDRERVNQRLHDEVQTARHFGATWAQIGDALGITRQSAHERFKSTRVFDN